MSGPSVSASAADGLDREEHLPAPHPVTGGQVAYHESGMTLATMPRRAGGDGYNVSACRGNADTACGIRGVDVSDEGGCDVADPFQVRIKVRGYELDTQGHLNQSVYLQYGEHVRWELLSAAGISQDALISSGVGPVQLEATIRYRRELRGGDEVDVTCDFEWGGGRTFQIHQDYRRTDGVVAAELTGVVGVLDLKTRRLVADPAERFRALAAVPELLGL